MSRLSVARFWRWAAPAWGGPYRTTSLVNAFLKNRLSGITFLNLEKRLSGGMQALLSAAAGLSLIGVRN